MIYEMDGGISLENLSPVLEAGVEIVVAGSAVFGAPDIPKQVGAFLAKMKPFNG